MMEPVIEPKMIMTYKIPGDIRKELGYDCNDIECIKIVSFSDRMNTRGVYLCTKNNDVLEEVAPTPMQACGLITLLNGKFVLIQSKGETTLHYVNAKNEDDIIDEVHMLSEKSGLADGINTFKSQVPRLDLDSTEMM
jgi:hypothetical protein